MVSQKQSTQFRLVIDVHLKRRVNLDTQTNGIQGQAPPVKSEVTPTPL